MEDVDAARYQRELAALAALHDPRICTAPNIPAGESLEARLRRDPLLPGAALAFAIEIVSALEAPHRLGILHRSLTVANIWLLPSGEIRLLNFDAPRSRAATAGGSPRETADTSQPLDPRDDLYAFGAVLKALSGGHDTPLLRRIIRRCLEHNPDRRYQSATALREDLEHLSPQSDATPARSLPWRLLAFLIIALVIGGVTWWKLASLPSGPLPVPDLTFSQATFTANIAAAALSPDGKVLATVHRTPSGDALFLRSLTTGRERRLVAAGAGCCAQLSISPDDSAVYFLAAQKLEALSLASSALRTIAPLASSGAAFSPSGVQIAFLNAQAQLTLAEADGSSARVLSALPFSHLTPAWSPDGQSIAAATASSLDIVSTATGAITAFAARQFRTISGIAWLPTGRGLLLTASLAPHSPQQVWQVPYPSGALAQVTNDTQGYAALASSSAGTLALLHSAPEASLWVQAARGSDFTELPGGGLTRAGAEGLAWLSNGSILATHIFHHDHQLWAISSDGAQAAPLSLKGVSGSPLAPLVTSGGAIVFLARTGARVRLWRANADGSAATPLSDPSPTWTALGLIRQGKQVEFLSGDHLWAVPVAGGVARKLWRGSVTQLGNAASPDGRHILVFAPQPTLLTLHGDSITASAFPLDRAAMLPPYGWTPDGRFLTFLRRLGSTEHLWALPLSGAPPHPLTHLRDLSIFAYAFSPDGRLALSRGRLNANVYLAHDLSSKK